MAKEIEKTYQPNVVEENIYRQWEQSGFFDPDKLPANRYPPSAKPFTVIMPPPNANGALHIGHAVFVTLQDIMVRFERMRGRKTLWLPGADHAGFETQVVFEKKLEKEGRNRFQIPRDVLYREMMDFTLANKKTMEAQLRKLGASCDWSREKFTLDQDIVKIVYETFYKLYEDDLLYRDVRVVNWCPKHQTALSDLEVKYVERTDPLYYIKYGPLTVATVRPETKFGDIALAVNPKDKRYKDYIGKVLDDINFVDEFSTGEKPRSKKRKLKVIADEAVDPTFGTGVVKVTPYHDAADFEIWNRHRNEIFGPIRIIDDRGRLFDLTPRYAGLKVMEARKKVAADMQELGMLEKIDPTYKHQIAVCYKCESTLEPLPKVQWFIRMTVVPHAKNKKQNAGGSLRDMAVDAVKRGEVAFIPKRMEKIFMHWMKNLRDWNISRQIAWGIQIPAWYCGACRSQKPDDWEYGVFVGESFDACPTCGEKNNFKRDPDVFDTWFSSGQWPFATLLASRGSKSKIKNQKSKILNDFDEFYPTDVMETGWDILFFWVARMIMLGRYRTGKTPFKTVYLHGLVRDKDRQKMSKSKGNVIDPLGVAEQYGTDAVRMALTVGNLPGNDIIISEEKIRGYRNFANKLWNIHRFILMNVTHDAKETKAAKGAKAAYSNEDKKRLAELRTLVKRVTSDLEHFRFHHAAEKLYHYVWHTFADKIIESLKPRLESKDAAKKASAEALLLEIHQTILKLLHPFMPFITEELWAHLPERAHSKQERSLLMVAEWPK